MPRLPLLPMFFKPEAFLSLPWLGLQPCTYLSLARPIDQPQVTSL